MNCILNIRKWAIIYRGAHITTKYPFIKNLIKYIKKQQHIWYHPTKYPSNILHNTALYKHLSVFFSTCKILDAVENYFTQTSRKASLQKVLEWLHHAVGMLYFFRVNKVGKKLIEDVWS